jgi:hypothetical protein
LFLLSISRKGNLTAKRIGIDLLAHSPLIFFVVRGESFAHDFGHGLSGTRGEVLRHAVTLFVFNVETHGRSLRRFSTIRDFLGT